MSRPTLLLADDHVIVADIGLERLRDDRLLCTDRILDVHPMGSTDAASIGAEWTLGEQLFAVGGEQEGGAVDRGEQAGVGVEISLRRVRGSDIRLGDLDSAERQYPLQVQEFLVQIIGYALHESMLFRDQHIQKLLAERTHRCQPDCQNRDQEQYRCDRRRLRGERRLRGAPQP